MSPLKLCAASIACMMLASGCSRQPQEGAEADTSAPKLFKMTLQLDWIAEPEHGGFYQALEKGYFKEAGLDVTILEGGQNAFVMQKLATGKVDLGQEDSTNTLIAIAQGLPVIQVGAVFQNDPSVLMLHQENPVNRFEDLDGKTIVARPEWAFLPYLKNKYHIKFNLVPQAFAVANFIADPTYIQQGYYTAEPYYIMKGGGKYPKFLFAWDAGFDAYTAIVANRSWAENNPARLRAFMAAYIRGWRDYLHGDRTPAHAVMKRLNPNDTDEFLAFCDKTMIEGGLVNGRHATDDSQIGRITRERFAVQIKQLEDLGIIPKGRLSVDQVMTTSYLP
jgi:NitT/TauT family transport system substrate-binding protein